jgi:predicted enzyme related to lactoylglutathione lyase
MASPVVHFEIRSADPDATRSFFGKLFGWTFPEGGIPGYSYVDTALDAAVVQGGKIIQPATSVPGVTFGLLADPQGQVVGLASADS